MQEELHTCCWEQLQSLENSHRGEGVHKTRPKPGAHNNMELECEDTSQPFKYLCSEVHASGKKFDIRFHNRNTIHFTNTGTQLFPCFQHWHSFSPCKQKLAVVISTFYRISRSCNSWTNIVDAVSNMKNELLSLKYPLRVLLRAAGRMATTDARWTSIEGAWRVDSRR